MLENMGKTRRAVLSVPHFLFVSALVTQSDMVAMLRSRLIRLDDPLYPVHGNEVNIVIREQGENRPKDDYPLLDAHLTRLRTH